MESPPASSASSRTRRTRETNRREAGGLACVQPVPDLFAKVTGPRGICPPTLGSGGRGEAAWTAVGDRGRRIIPGRPILEGPGGAWVDAGARHTIRHTLDG